MQNNNSNNDVLINYVNDYMDSQIDKFSAISDAIWDHPETRFNEHFSANLLADTLENEGFDVERGIANIDTAFVASFGSGFPIIALLGEYDALAGLSQQAGCANKRAITQNGNGHGCGHNILGTAALAGAIAVKAFMQDNNISGTIRFYGCPGEEGGSGKTFMVRDGVFDDVDIALTWHPEAFSGMFNNPTLANIQTAFRFKGIAAHAANSPHLGRSALDAVTLMTVGTNFLNEHIISDARVHYAITNTGGISPNVVQADAEVLYLVRAPQITQAQQIYQRVIKIAQGAALMTETEVEINFIKACSNYVPNRALEKIMYTFICTLGTPSWSDDDYQFANAIRQTITPNELANALDNIARTAGEAGRIYAEEVADQVLTERVAPYCESKELMFGSTDVGDVSWVVPTAQCYIPCFAIGTPLHTWQLVAQGRTSIAHKGLHLASRVLAATALSLLTNPTQIEQCKQEFIAYRNKHNYVNPIPSDITPSPIK